VLCIETTVEVGHYMVLAPPLPPLPPPRALGCLVPFAHGVALLCMMTIFQIDLNCIKVFAIILMFP